MAQVSFLSDPSVIAGLLSRRRKRIVAVDQRFGRLRFTGQYMYCVGPPANNYIPTLACECVCDCGKTVVVRSQSLLHRETVSCGCWRREQSGRTGLRNAKYSPSVLPVRRRLTNVWMGMMSRCYRRTDVGWKNYGGRGITVYPDWHSITQFISWAVGSGYRPGLTLDRYPDNNGNYEPENTRWATPKQQGVNKRSNRKITAWGETKCLSEWASDDRCSSSGAKAATMISARLKLGWHPEASIRTPPRRIAGGA